MPVADTVVVQSVTLVGIGHTLIAGYLGNRLGGGGGGGGVRAELAVAAYRF